MPTMPITPPSRTCTILAAPLRMSSLTWVRSPSKRSLNSRTSTSMPAPICSEIVLHGPTSAASRSHTKSATNTSSTNRPAKAASPGFQPRARSLVLIGASTEVRISPMSSGSTTELSAVSAVPATATAATITSNRHDHPVDTSSQRGGLQSDMAVNLGEPSRSSAQREPALPGRLPDAVQSVATSAARVPMPSCTST